MTTPIEELVMLYGAAQGGGAWCPKIVPLKLNHMEVA